METGLPLLVKPQYYSQLKSGKCKGGETGIMAENIRVYNNILNRHGPPYQPYERIPEKITGGLRHPLQTPPILHWAVVAYNLTAIFSSPPRYGRKTAGMLILPSAF